MARRTLARLIAALMLGLAPMPVAPMTSAQPAPVQVIQGSDGTLYLVQGSNAWTLVPDPISEDELAGLSPSGELDAAIPSPLLAESTLPGALRVVHDGGGTLYLVQGGNAWTLLAAPISDEDLAVLAIIGELNGTVVAPGQNAPAANPGQGVPIGNPGADAPVVSVNPAPADQPPATAMPSPSPTVAPTSSAGTHAVTKGVLGTAGPWKYVKGGLNSSFPYSEFDPPGFPTAATAFNTADGLNFAADKVLHLRYVSGGTNQSAAYPLTDAIGNLSWGSCPRGGLAYGKCPSEYVTGAKIIMELIGTFATASGEIVGRPFALGNTNDLVIPAGASQLLLGVNDTGYFNNTGSMQISVS